MSELTLLQAALAVMSGGLVGFALGLVGGGGSILAVPLLVYVVGIPSPHVAIGTSAVAVAGAGALSLLHHIRAHNVRWPCALSFTVAGIAGAAIGAHFGQRFDGQKLLALFGLLMIVVGALMLRRRGGAADEDVRLTRDKAARLLPRLLLIGLIVGLLSGFFGIGGGFLVVPGLIGATAMPVLSAIGSSLVSVAAFGATTATSYALSGLVDWPAASAFVVGAAGGGFVGSAAVKRLSHSQNGPRLLFAIFVALVGVYVALRGIGLI
ncbi:MAG: sulfite exporter TauE/SafE family protein [Alphaproteobacteria bacterium]